jgi:O-antigen/teichoic acid export membrane protein
MKDLKEKTIRGGFARLCAQIATFALRIGSLMVLARILGPKDFGLVGMVTAFTGVLMLFRDFGLSSAAIQRANVTEEQMSTLFWVNILSGVVLASVLIVAAPLIAAFYRDSRLVAVTVVLSAGFFFNAAGVQHLVVLQREMRFTALSIVGVVSLAAGTAIGIVGAKAGYGYWALVAMTVSTTVFSTAGFWATARWLPGRPHRGCGLRSMIRFGGAVTLNSLVVYVATNFEKILLGRFWGPAAIGLYGRAYQLVNIPTDNLNSAAGEVAFAGLSRLQEDPPRLRKYFLKGYSLVLTFTVPVTIACALFAADIIRVLLGPKWAEAVPIFRLLAPTILVFAIANPLSWLLSSLGLVSRLLKMSMVIAPVMIAGYFIGLPHGPKGVALAYSAIMALWLVPLVLWAVHGTTIAAADIFRAAMGPLVASLFAATVAFAIRKMYGQYLSPALCLIVESTVMLTIFLSLMYFVAGDRSLYSDLLRSLKIRRAEAENVLA